jgi:predicted ATPase/DNA-binding SARP family transcriptional activator
LLSIFLLGTLEVKQGSKPLNGFESNKVRALLAYLAVESNRPHTRDALAALLWPDSTQEAALCSLRNALANLRRTIGDQNASPRYLLITRETIQFNPASNITLDIAHLLQPISGDTAQAEIQFRTASVESYRGPFLQGFSVHDSAAFEEWVSLWRERLDLRLLDDLHWLANYYEGNGNLATALEYARRMVAIEPWMEEGHCQVMRLLALSGQRAQALHQYQILLEILQRDLDTDPSETATLLYQELLSGQFPSAVAAARPIHNLPVQLSTFIGREQESESLKQLILSAPTRMVTVTGAGGIGKTRLVLETAWSLLAHFVDGVFFIEINAQMTPDTLLAAIAGKVGLDMYSTPASPPSGVSFQARLRDYLEARRILLILDSFETILDAANHVLALLQATHSLKILITSRMRLNIEGESVFPLSGLKFPPELDVAETGQRFGSVDLFVQFARQVNPAFTLNANNHAAVASICRQLQGMPLGILLAAGWTSMLEPVEILAEIHRSLDFLSASWKSLPERQRSLRATFEYSWDLLSRAQQINLMRLSIFPASFSASRATQICGLSLPGLKTLFDQSLLQRSGENLYRMHDLLRQYSHEKLDENLTEKRSIQDRYCLIYLDLLADWFRRIKTSQQLQVLEEMNLEQDAIRLAWNWAIAQMRNDIRIDALDGLCRYYLILSRTSEGLQVCTQSLEQLEHQDIASTSSLYCALRRWEAIYRWNLGQMVCAYQVINALVLTMHNVSQDSDIWRKELASALVLQAQFEHQYPSLQTLDLALQGLELHRSLRDNWSIAYALTNLTEIHDRLGNRKECFDTAVEAIRILDPDGDPYLLNRCKTSLSYCYMMAGDGDLADKLVEELVPYYFKVGERYMLARAYAMLTYAHWYMGRYIEARLTISQYYESLGIKDFFHRTGVLRPAVNLLFLDGAISLFTGNYAGLIAHFTQLSTEDEYYHPLCLAVLGLLHILAGDYLQALPHLERSHEIYEHMPRKDHMGWPLSFLCLAHFLREEYADAQASLITGLEYSLKYPVFTGFCLCLGTLALILAEKGELVQAVELYQTVITHPWAGNSQLFCDLYQNRIEKIIEHSGEKIKISPGKDWREMRTLAQDYLAELRLWPNFCNPCKKKEGDAAFAAAPPY